jgi:hypothetical protein
MTNSISSTHIADAGRIAATTLGWVVGPIIGFVLGRWSQVESERRKAKADAVEVISRFEAQVGGGHDILDLWSARRPDIQAVVSKLSIHFSGSRRLVVEQAWQDCSQIKDTELYAEVRNDGPDIFAVIDNSKPKERLLTALRKLRRDVVDA